MTSSLTLLEVLVVPLKNRDEALVKNYRAVLENSDLALLQITAETMLEAARLRAEVNIKTPDAIHAASALVTG